MINIIIARNFNEIMYIYNNFENSIYKADNNYEKVKLIRFFNVLAFKVICYVVNNHIEIKHNSARKDKRNIEKINFNSIITKTIKKQYSRIVKNSLKNRINKKKKSYTDDRNFCYGLSSELFFFFLIDFYLFDELKQFSLRFSFIG